MPARATMDDLIDAMSSALGVDDATVAWLASKLDKAGLLGAPDVPATPLDAARLLIAVMGSTRPIDAVAIVHAFEAMPARFVTGGHGTGRWSTAIEDCPLPDGTGPAIAQLSRSLVSALVGYFESCVAGVPPKELPVEEIGIRRDPAHLNAFVRLGPNADGSSFEFVFTGADNASTEVRASVWAFVPASALYAIGNVVAGIDTQPTTVRERHVAAPGCS